MDILNKIKQAIQGMKYDFNPAGQSRPNLPSVRISANSLGQSRPNIPQQSIQFHPFPIPPINLPKIKIPQQPINPIGQSRINIPVQRPPMNPLGQSRPNIFGPAQFSNFPQPVKDIGNFTKYTGQAWVNAFTNKPQPTLTPTSQRGMDWITALTMGGPQSTTIKTATQTTKPLLKLGEKEVEKSLEAGRLQPGGLEAGFVKIGKDGKPAAKAGFYDVTNAEAIIKERGFISDIGQITPAEKKILDQKVKTGELVKYRGDWRNGTPENVAPTMGSAKTIYRVAPQPNAGLSDVKALEDLGFKKTVTPIKSNGKIVGGIDASPHVGDPETLRVHHIRISPDEQGKGLGTKAVNQLFKENPNVKRIIGNATDESRSFWEKQGAKFSDGSTAFHIDRPNVAPQPNAGLSDTATTTLYRAGDPASKKGVFATDNLNYAKEYASSNSKVHPITITNPDPSKVFSAQSQMEAYAKLFPNDPKSEFINFKYLGGEKNLIKQYQNAKDFSTKAQISQELHYYRDLEKKYTNQYRLGVDDGNYNFVATLDRQIKSALKGKGYQMVEYTNPSQNGFRSTKGAKEYSILDESLLKSRVAQQPIVDVTGAVKPQIPLAETPQLPKAPLVNQSVDKQAQPLKIVEKTPLQSLNQKSKKVNQSFDDIVDRSNINVKSKVNILDYLRTPDRVLKKMGLEKESDLIRKKYDDYLDEMPKEIDKITQWSKRVPKESNQRIFQYLDGQPVKLQREELKIANEVKQYLKSWADRLNLPQEKRITNYITHIFEKDFIQKEFDPDIAKLIRDRVPGSVYDPFVEERLGKAGYIEDTWKALDAYVKRATRKANMDEALKQISNKADSLEESQFNYIKKYVDKVNMRPGQLDNLIDNTVKSVIGYKLGQRPLAATSRTLRQMVYRGTLGLNIGSAIRNLTQGANTYAKLGEKYTLQGYYKAARAIAARDDELERVGVLRDNFIQDRTISATGKFWENLDKGLWSFFQAAEKINRGSAYYGAKAKALAQGATIDEAIQAGKNMVRDTQFTFGSVDTPQILQSDIAKSLLQFQSYNLKQAEFLTEMARNKEFAGLIRFGIASTAILFTIGKLIGMKPTDFLPFYGVATGETKLGQTPPVKLGMDIAKTVVGAKDEYGNQPDLGDRASTFIDNAIPFIPAGVQIKKSIDALQDYQKGFDATRTGLVKYPIDQTKENLLRGTLFGSNKLPQAQEYYDQKRSPLSKNQTNLFKEATDKAGVYATIIGNRIADKQKDLTKEKIKAGDTSVDAGQDDSLIKTQVETDRIGRYDSKGNYVYSPEPGKSKTIDLTAPDKGLGGFVASNWQVNKAINIWKNNELSSHEKNVLYDKLKQGPQDVEYAAKASYSNDIKSQYVISKAQNMDHDSLLNELVKGRVVGINGDQFASNGVIDSLYNEGIISKEEQVALKKIKTDKSGKSLVAGGGKKAKKIKISIAKVSTPKTTNIKIKLSKPKGIKIKKSPTIKLTTSKKPAKFKVSKIKTKFGKPTLST